MPHTPNSGQLSQLATLQAAVTSTAATLASAQTSLAIAQKNYAAAVAAAKQYEGFIWGNNKRPSVIDEGAENI